MVRARIEQVAREIARERQQCFGLSVFASADGWPTWLVGTREELERAGVPAEAIVDGRSEAMDELVQHIRRCCFSDESRCSGVSSVEIERVYIDPYGYNRQGMYFGAEGEQLFRLTFWPDERSDIAFVRAPNRKALRTALKVAFPNAKIGR